MAWPVIIAAAALGYQVYRGAKEDSKAKKADAKAEALNSQIPKEGPRVTELLQDYKMRRDYAEAGQSRRSTIGRRLGERGALQTMQNMARNAGTAPGTAQLGFLRAQNTMNQGNMQAGALDDQVSLGYSTAMGPLVSDMDDRSLSLQTYMRDLSAFRAAQHRQNVNTSINSGMGSMVQMAGSFKSGDGGGYSGDTNDTLYGPGAVGYDWDASRKSSYYLDNEFGQ